MTDERYQTGGDVTARIAENVFADWIIDAIMGHAMPPRDPNDDDDDDEEEEEDEDSASDDEVEPAVVREPDE
jgi:hypothetical protein